jgi:FixJ family two-component response regulator
MNAALASNQHLTIVVVEDDAGMRKAIVRLLRAAGFQPVSFASAEELLKRTRRTLRPVWCWTFICPAFRASS